MSQKLRSLREKAAGSRFFCRPSAGKAAPCTASGIAASELPDAAVKDGPDAISDLCI